MWENLNQHEKLYPKVYVVINIQNKKYVCDEKFERNVLIVLHSICGKTIFLQKLAVNNLFCELKEVKWMPKTELKSRREAKIEFYFNPEVNFYYLSNTSEFEHVFFKKEKEKWISSLL